MPDCRFFLYDFRRGGDDAWDIMMPFPGVTLRSPPVNVKRPCGALVVAPCGRVG